VLLPQPLLPPEALTHATSKAETALGDESTGEADWKEKVRLWDHALCFSIPLAYTLQCYPGPAEFKPLAAVVCAPG